jgi:hypothetical protein
LFTELSTENGDREFPCHAIEYALPIDGDVLWRHLPMLGVSCNKIFHMADRLIHVPVFIAVLLSEILKRRRHRIGICRDKNELAVATAALI